MKTYTFTLLICACALIACNTDAPTSKIEKEVEAVAHETDIEVPVTGYDSLKAAEYGADAYGMRKYVMAFLKRGPNRDLPKAQADSLQAAHMANIGRMANEGKLVVAGPFFDNGDLRGIYVFAVESLEEAEALTNSDPAIQAGSLVMELKEWYGSAALMALNDIHSTLAKENI